MFTERLCVLWCTAFRAIAILEDYTVPRPADFEKPLVEKTRVLHEIRGDVKSGQFGWIARRIGDVDGDKVADFTTSAPTYPVEGTPAVASTSTRAAAGSCSGSTREREASVSASASKARATRIATGSPM